uniref:Uncharacterized protein n=1 Tax=Mus spicilegus TaxID=10103 RepID=A0A8C6H4H2_MUSSI
MASASVVGCASTGSTMTSLELYTAMCVTVMQTDSFSGHHKKQNDLHRAPWLDQELPFRGLQELRPRQAAYLDQLPDALATRWVRHAGETAPWVPESQEPVDHRTENQSCVPCANTLIHPQPIGPLPGALNITNIQDRDAPMRNLCGQSNPWLMKWMDSRGDCPP